MTRTRTAKSLATFAIAALALTGCSALDQQQPPQASTEGDKGTVTILTHDSFQISDEQIAAFKEQTGYTLATTAPGDAGVVLNQLVLSKGSPSVDGVYGLDNYSAQSAVDAGVLEPYTSAALPASASSLAFGDALTPIDQGQVCMNIDTAWFAEHGVAEPTGFEQLATPDYAKLMVLMNPAESSPGFAFLAATHAKFGDAGATQFWTDALANGVKIDSGWSDAYGVDFSAGEGKGEYPLVLSYSSSPAETEGATTTMVSTCTPQVEYAAVVAGAKNPEGAKAFIDFLLGDDFQQGIPESMYMYPVNDKIDLPTEWAKYAQLTPDPIKLDPAEVGANREAWIKEWTAIFEANS